MQDLRSICLFKADVYVVSNKGQAGVDHVTSPTPVVFFS